MSLTSSDERTVVDPVMVGNSVSYLAQLVFMPVQLTSDDSAYACEVVVNAGLEFVRNAQLSSDSTSLRARGNEGVC